MVVLVGLTTPRTIKRSPAPGCRGCAAGAGVERAGHGAVPRALCSKPGSLGAPTTCRRVCRALGCPSGTASTNGCGWTQGNTRAGQAGQTPPLSWLWQHTEPCIISGIIAKSRAACTDLSKMMYTPETHAASQPLLSPSDLVLRAVGFKGVAQFWTVNSALLVKGEPKRLHRRAVQSQEKQQAPWRSTLQAKLFLT